MRADASGKPLSQKLGVKPGMTVLLVNPPAGYGVTLGPLPPRVRLINTLGDSADLIQLFVTDSNTLENEFPKLAERVKDDGMVWVSWPKKSSGLQTDLSDVTVRSLGLRNGMVDVKVCSVDDRWSGLKFVRKLSDRRRV